MTKMECLDCGRIFSGYSSERFCLHCTFYNPKGTARWNLEPKVHDHES